jgi:hypothetical protein
MYEENKYQKALRKMKDLGKWMFKEFVYIAIALGCALLLAKLFF